MRYLDHAATTPIFDEVLEAMLPYLKEHFGNTSSVYAIGREAKKGLEEAREQVAWAIGANPGEVIFTAGGTEADNQALKAAAFKMRANGDHIITASTEHHAVLHAAEWLERQGFRVTFLRVDNQGRVDIDELKDSIGPKTTLVSIMHVNNEVGTIQPIAEIVEVVKSSCRALVHTDAVQALGKIGVDVESLGVDLASFAAHKIGGPKGTGALYVRRRTPFESILHGGGQERDLRSGTPNVAGIVGFGAAAQIATRDLEEEGKRLGAMRDGLENRLKGAIAGIHLNGANAPRVATHSNVCIEGVEGESLLLMLDAEQIAASSGSACTSGSLDPSHVLVAMGVDRKLALGSLRISLGRSSRQEDIDHLLDKLPSIVERLRSIGS